MTDARERAFAFKPVEHDPEWSRRASGGTIAAFVLAVAMTVTLLVIKTLAAIWNYADSFEDYSQVASALGTLMLLTIVPALAAVAFARGAIGDTRGIDRRGGVLAAIALGVGLFHVLLWFNRVVNAIIASIANDSVFTFTQHLFLWS